MSDRCFACGRKLGKNPALADTRDDQFVFVGAECFRLIKAAGATGFQPSRGGPRLYLMPTSLTQQQLDRIRQDGGR